MCLRSSPSASAPSIVVRLALALLLTAGIAAVVPRSAAEAATGAATENAETDAAGFVSAAYAGLLGRAPDPGGLEHWTGELADGVSRTRVISAIGDSDEQRRNVVDAAYQAILDRRPDPRGQEFWASGIIDRLTVQELQAQIFASVEFFERSGGTNADFVEQLYERILDRDSERAGLDYWVGKLDGSSSRRDIADAFLVSAEGLSQPTLSILEANPGRGAMVSTFSGIDIELDRSIRAESSAVIVSIDGQRIAGSTEAVAQEPDTIRFRPGVRVGPATRDRPVVVTVFAYDGSTVDRVDYAFTLAAGASVIPPGPQTDNENELMVAYYGHPTTDALGIAGEGTPEVALERLLDQAAAYRAPGRTVIPVFEMIATLVTASPGPDRLYRARADEAALRQYLDTIRMTDGRMILDIQPGRADVLDEAMAFESLLIEPDVGLALDPEWVVGPDQSPAGRVGTLDASDINRVSAYLARLVERHDLPPRILIVHRFDPSMVTNTDAIDDPPGVRIIFHADGEGGPDAKIADYDTLMPPRFERGIKIFYDEDTNRLSPEQVLSRLDPTPAFVSYQ